MSQDDLRKFSRQLRERLLEKGIPDERIVSEATEHLAESRARLLREGVPETEAARRAVSRFGSPRDLAAAFELELLESPGLWRVLQSGMEENMTKPILPAIALFTALLALFTGVHTLLEREGHLWMIALKLFGSAAILAVGAMTWLRHYQAGFRHATALLLGGLLLVAFGAAGAVATLYLAEKTGDLEAWAIPANSIILAQGVITVLHVWLSGRRETARR